jgi:hypothetical protein
MLRKGGSPWGQTALFGYTGELASNHCDLETVRYLTSNSTPSAAGKTRAGQKYVLGRRVEVILRDGKEDAAFESLELYLTHFAPPSRKILKRSFDAALSTGSVKIIERLSTNVAVRPWHDVFRNSFLGHQKYPENVASIIHGFLRRGVFDRNNINGKKFRVNFDDRPSGNTDALCLLDIAVSTLDQNLVDTALRHGAHPDGIPLLTTSFIHALGCTIQLGHMSIVKLLVYAGADVVLDKSQSTCLIMKSSKFYQTLLMYRIICVLL